MPGPREEKRQRLEQRQELEQRQGLEQRQRLEQRQELEQRQRLEQRQELEQRLLQQQQQRAMPASDYSINLTVQQVLSLWAHGTLRHFTEMWYWVFLWALFSSLFVHGAVGLLMFVMLQRHKHGRVVSVVAVLVGFLASVTGGMITSAAVAGVYRVAGKTMVPLEALVFGAGQTLLTAVISFSRILATL
ncbi:transmembrane protein 170B [Rhinoraja longicauda]